MSFRITSTSDDIRLRQLISVKLRPDISKQNRQYLFYGLRRGQRLSYADSSFKFWPKNRRGQIRMSFLFQPAPHPWWRRWENLGLCLTNWKQWGCDWLLGVTSCGLVYESHFSSTTVCLEAYFFRIILMIVTFLVVTTYVFLTKFRLN
jgi:hypothetical protein